MSNLLEMPLVLAALAFMAGYVLAKLGAWFTRKEKTDGKHDPDRDRQYRGMEADLRVARKQLEQAETDMAAVKQERGELQAELDDRGGELLEATSQLEDLRGQLKDECDKTQGLRSELSNRAEEGIRAQVQLRDAETELSLAQAGSDAVNDEISWLANASSSKSGWPICSAYRQPSGRRSRPRRNRAAATRTSWKRRTRVAAAATWQSTADTADRLN